MSESSPTNKQSSPQTSRLFARLAHRNDKVNQNVGNESLNNHSKKKQFISHSNSTISPSAIKKNNNILLNLCQIVKKYILKKFLLKWSQLATELALKEIIPSKLKHAGRIRQLSKNLDSTEQEIDFILNESVNNITGHDDDEEGVNEFDNIMKSIDFNTLDDLTKTSQSQDQNLTKYRTSSRSRYYVENSDIEMKTNNSQDFDFLNGDISDIISVNSMIVKNDIHHQQHLKNHLHKEEDHASHMNKTPIKDHKQHQDNSVLHFEERLKSANKKIKSLENMYLYQPPLSQSNNTPLSQSSHTHSNTHSNTYSGRSLGEELSISQSNQEVNTLSYIFIL